MLDALAETSTAAGNPAEACARFAQAEEIQRRLGDHVNRGWSLGGLVETCRLQGELVAAVRWLREFVAFLRQDLAPTGYRRSLLLEAAEVARVAGDWEAVAWVAGALAALSVPTESAADPQQLKEHARAVIGDDAVEEATRWGAATPPVEVAQRVVDTLTVRADT